ncbi:hypothetical protein V9K67_26835 [Paraflavisolibacter sp. H34]|uniref:hypothetical protein n=1 Tax=Huijunlia imazamoxiresistens TaxID=3127457 RepID=UPI00301B579B
MLKKLLSLLGFPYSPKDTPPKDSIEKKRLRFEEIHNDQRFNYLRDVYTRLLSGDSSLSDAEILERYLKFSDRIQTNTFAAAELEWATISTLCYYRPKLVRQLIRRGLLAIVYSLGEEIDSTDVFDFIQHRILDSAAEPCGGLPHSEGRVWLTELLPQQQDLVQQTLDEVIAENRKELENM